MKITQANYMAWFVREEDYPVKNSICDKLKFLLRYAVLSPSAHNTQPWLFSVRDNAICVYLNKERMLKESDPVLRQTYESMGACVANIFVAACHFGLSYVANYVLEKGEEDGQKKLIIILLFRETSNNSRNQGIGRLLRYIPLRRSAKLGYRTDSPDKTTMSLLKSLSDFEGIQVHFFDKRELVEKMSEVVSEGTKAAFEWPAFCQELSGWVKPNWTKDYDGMPGFTVGMPGPISWIMPKVIAKFNISTMQAKMAQKQIKETPALGIITSRENSPRYWFEAGRIFQIIALTALERGWHTALMGAHVEMEHAVEKLQMVTGVADRPIIFFRIGKQRKEVAYTPRRPFEQCVVDA